MEQHQPNKTTGVDHSRIAILPTSAAYCQLSSPSCEPELTHASPMASPTAFLTEPCSRTVPPSGSFEGHSTSCPSELVPMLQWGKPLRLSSLVEDDCVEFYAARFPADVDLYKLASPVTIRRDAPQMDEDDTAEVDCPDTKQCPWRIVDANNRNFVGRKDGLDTHTYFLHVDHGTYGELVPLSGWYTFRPEVPNGRRPKNLAERMRQARGSRLQSTPNSRKRPLGTLDTTDELGLKRHERKQAKRLRKKRRAEANEGKDGEDAFDSALNLGHVKKANVDWDFGGDEFATDDEDNAVGSDADLPDANVSEFDDSDEENEELSKFGQKMSQLLENQREKEADDELAQISEEEEELDEEISESNTTVAAIPLVDNSIAVQAEGGAAVGMHDTMLAVHRSSSIHGTVLTPPGAGGGTAAGAVDLSSSGLAAGRVDAPRTNVTPAASSSPRSSDAQRAELQQSFIRSFNRHCGRMTPRQIMDELKITSKNSKFLWVRQFIRDLCSIEDSEQHGKLLELKEAYRTF